MKDTIVKITTSSEVAMQIKRGEAAFDGGTLTELRPATWEQLAGEINEKGRFVKITQFNGEKR